MSRSKVVVSSGVMVYVNGRPFGRATSFKFSSSTPRVEKYGIDSSEPFELMPTTSSVQCSLGIIRTVGDGGSEGAGMSSRFEHLQTEKYFSIELVEIISDTRIFSAMNCSVASQSWNVEPKGIVRGSLEIKALNWTNEVKTLSTP